MQTFDGQVIFTFGVLQIIIEPSSACYLVLGDIQNQQKPPI